MTSEEKISKIKELWIATFGDSREYVDMIIDGYYDDQICLNIVEGESLISSSVVIPYEFTKFSDNTKDEKTEFDNASKAFGDNNIVYLSKKYNEGIVSQNYDLLNGDYLCGLATIESRRGEGLMRDIISSIERNSKNNNSAFTFLIPADETLRRYYKKLGYEDAAKKTIISVSKKSNTNGNFRDLNIYETIATVRDKVYDHSWCNRKIELNDKNVSDGDATSTYRDGIRPDEIRVFENYGKNYIIDDTFKDSLDNIIRNICKFEDTICSYLSLRTNLKSDNIYSFNLTDSIIKSNFLNVRHTYKEWNDILTDLLRDGATLSVMKSSQNFILSVLIITNNKKIYPVFGEIDSVVSHLQNIVYNRACAVSEDFSEFEKFDIICFHPIYGRLMADCIKHDGVFSSYDVKVGMYSYGMAKIFRSDLRASDIVFGFMFD